MIKCFTLFMRMLAAEKCQNNLELKQCRGQDQNLLFGHFRLRSHSPHFFRASEVISDQLSNDIFSSSSHQHSRHRQKPDDKNPSLHRPGFPTAGALHSHSSSGRAMPCPRTDANRQPGVGWVAEAEPPDRALSRKAFSSNLAGGASPSLNSPVCCRHP